MVTVTLTLPTGKRKYFYGGTKEEAIAKREKAKIEISKGYDIGDTSTVADLAEIWLTQYKEGVVRDGTLLNYRSLINSSIIPLLGGKRVIAVKPVDIRVFVKQLNDKSAATQRHILGILKSIFDVALENELIPRNPVVHGIKATGEPSAKREALTTAQITELMAAAKGSLLYPFVLVTLYGGLRKSEALGLMWSDVDFERGTIKVNRSLVYSEENHLGELSTDLKTEAAHREVPLPLWVVAELRKIKSANKSLFVVSRHDGAGMTMPGFQKNWQILTKSLSFHVFPHLLRHTCITVWIENGLAVKETQYIAGHSTPDITLGVYTHYRFEDSFDSTVKKIQAR